MANKDNKTNHSDKNVAGKKPGLFTRLKEFFKGLKSEFKKITWSSRSSTWKNFLLVMVIVVAAAVVIGLIDGGLQALFNAMFKGFNNLFFYE